MVRRPLGLLQLFNQFKDLANVSLLGVSVRVSVRVRVMVRVQEIRFS